MCTAISVTIKDHYFGRNLDYEHGFGEKITITPRYYGLDFKCGKVIDEHYAIIGMGLPIDGYPLYFDAVNEEGLGMAGLNFPDNAHYMQDKDGRDNIASFEFIPWILSQCKTTDEAEELIEEINITKTSFSEDMPPTPLHWIISDRKKSITIEQTKDGIRVFQNPTGVLTNNPTFDMQMFYLTNFLKVSPEEPSNGFSEKINFEPYSRGMGGMGLPGDLSSMSRFVKACFTKLNSEYGSTEEEAVAQFFHILYSVYQQKGCVRVGDGFEITNYTSCCNTSKGIYYYTTYNNLSINAVSLHKENLNTSGLITYDLFEKSNFNYQN